MTTTPATLPARTAALAAVRLYGGIFWLLHAVGKFQDPNWAVRGGTCERFLHGMIDVQSGAYHDFVLNVVLPNIEIFAHLVQYGELLTGISLLLGLLTWVGASGGVFLALNYFLAKGSLVHLDAYAGLEALAIAYGVACLILPVGRAFGLDALIFRRRT